MPKIRKLGQKSVGIQSTQAFEQDLGFVPQTAKLCKKTGFRNLLQKSVTIVRQEHDDTLENVSAEGGKMSRSVQAALGTDNEYVNKGYRVGVSDLDFSTHPGLSLKRNEGSRGSTSEVVKLIDRGPGSANPGTSRMVSAVHSSLSLTSQVNDRTMKPHDGSLAVVYNYGDKPEHEPRLSNAAFYYGSQGSRRFSDETVLLIEDYMSYDYTNAARRQEASNTNTRRNVFSCCRRIRRSSLDVSNRPIPIAVDDIREEEEGLVCRICHEGEDVHGPLLQPCLCKGSVGCVHGYCLKVWLEQSNTSRCELCNYPYAIRQTKKYTKCYSIRVYFRAVIDRRSMAYDVISFVVITPLTLVGVAMCIQASVYSTAEEVLGDPNFQMGNITRAGMIMLSVTIIVAYCVWIYTLISYHYKAWKKWYSNCYDVEVLPVRMTSEDRLEAARRISEEINRRQLSREQGSGLLTVLTPAIQNDQRPQIVAHVPSVTAAVIETQSRR